MRARIAASAASWAFVSASGGSTRAPTEWIRGRRRTSERTSSMSPRASSPRRVACPHPATRASAAAGAEPLASASRAAL